jgi:hypothetical protein
MPNRLIRDGLLESEAVLSLTIEARWLYIAICLTADDMGLFEATEFRLARRADLKKEHIQRLLSMLNDVDLIRLYSDGKKTFGIIPKFRQRLQIKRIKYPIPPESLYIDDEDAIEKFNKLKMLASKTTATQQLDSGSVSVAQQSEPELEPEPEPKNKKHITPDGVSDFVFKDYLAVRKAKKSPWTQTALKGLQREAEKAKMSLQDVMQLCCERNWVGFKAEWANSQNPVSKQGDDKSWMFSNQGIEAKAKELGVNDYGIQNHQQLKDKVLLVMAKKAMQ